MTSVNKLTNILSQKVIHVISICTSLPEAVGITYKSLLQCYTRDVWLCLQEYIPSKPSNAVRSLMYLIDMLLHEAINAPDAEHNKAIRTWAIVSTRFFVSCYFEFSWLA